MGKIVTPKYRVEMWFSESQYTQAPWDVKSRGMIKGLGRPTIAKLQAQVKAFEASTQPGGCNERLGPMRVTRAAIIEQKPFTIVAEWTADPA